MSSNPICGYVSLMYSVADKPLELWSKHVSLGGKVRRVNDDMLHGDKVIEILGPHDSLIPTSITAPAKVVDVLNIRLAILVLVIKNLKSPFKLEVQITDRKQCRRRFSFLTYNLEKLPSVTANVAHIPLKLEECWNILEINLQILCHMAYGMDYEALQRIIVHPNCRLRRVYLQDRHYDHDETPVELCNAFFDTYMSKWGINFIEKTCQTEEYHTEPLRERDSNLLVNNSRTVPLTKADLPKDTNDTNKPKNLNAFGTIVNSCDSKTLKKNYVSLGILNNKVKIQNIQNVMKRRSWSHSKSLTNESIVENKPKEISNNITEKGNRNKGTSQFLKIHVNKTLFRNNVQNKTEFPRRLHPYRIRDLGNIPII